MLFFTLHSSLFTSMAQPKKSRVQQTKQVQQQQKQQGPGPVPCVVFRIDCWHSIHPDRSATCKSSTCLLFVLSVHPVNVIIITIRLDDSKAYRENRAGDFIPLLGYAFRTSRKQSLLNVRWPSEPFRASTESPQALSHKKPCVFMQGIFVRPSPNGPRAGRHIISSLVLD